MRDIADTLGLWWMWSHLRRLRWQWPVRSESAVGGDRTVRLGDPTHVREIAAKGGSTADIVPPPPPPNAVGMRGSLSMNVNRGPSSPYAPEVRFQTQNSGPRHLMTSGKARALRFVEPIEQVVREIDLPVELPIGTGKIVVKRFTEIGITLEEINTGYDVWVHAEVTYAE